MTRISGCRINCSKDNSCWTSDTASGGRIPQLEVGYRVCKLDNGAEGRIPQMEVGYRGCTSDSFIGRIKLVISVTCLIFVVIGFQIKMTTVFLDKPTTNNQNQTKVFKMST